MQYSAMKTIGVVAKREMAVALKSKMVVGTMLLLILGAIIAPIAINFFSGDDEPDSVAIVGMEASAFDDSGIDATEAKDRAEAQQLVENDEADAALVPAENDGWDLLSKGDTPAAVTTPSTTVNQVNLEEEDDTEQKMAGVATVLIAAMVVVFSVMTFAGLIGGRVTEEKSSRVVEIILSSVRPVDFLAGKILGNTIIGFLATLLILGGGAISLAATGLAGDFELDYGLVAVLLVGEILGLLFFGSLYAAAGSMVQRTEDLQSTQAPILFLVFATMYVPMFGWMHLDATWMQVMTWLPPVSMLVAPMQVAGGNLSWLGLLASYVLMAVVTALIIVLVGRIYRRAILNNGRKMTWRQALGK
ncbi:MAG: ABC transporter permease [Corynebacterium sp.]|uniref:ABC transporter permease n=1 Tax=Corynebacterium sp. TaxID=1720 RepID=UPI00290362B5|nr:ABC transporter permease [Corynebacterium sp.]MDU2586304.1 ABC transporter permease [Corynebacterium sp.]